MNKPTDKQVEAALLDSYLKGDSALSDQYRNEAKEAPPAALDAAILQAARDEAPASIKETGPIPKRWLQPLSVAAVAVLSVTLMTYIQLEENIPTAQPTEDSVATIAAPAAATQNITEALAPELVVAAPERDEEAIATPDLAAIDAVPMADEPVSELVSALPERQEKVATTPDPAAYEEASAPADARESAKLSPAYGIATTGPSQAELADELTRARNSGRVQATSKPIAAVAEAEQRERILLMRESQSEEAKRRGDEVADQADIAQEIVVTGARITRDDVEDIAQAELLEDIATLWSQGDTTEARERLAEFDERYPDYDAELKRQVLPEALLDTD